MKRKSHIIALWVLLGALLSANTAAAYIVDTGVPPGPPADPSVIENQLILRNYQWIAGEFNVADTTTITDVEGYFRSSGVLGGTFTISLYGDGGEVPDANNLLFSDVATRAAGTTDRAWEGLTGIEWMIDPGTYWVSFEIRPTDNWSGAIMPGDAPNALVNDAYRFNGNWSEYDSLGMGVRIASNPVPVPAAAWLLGSGLVGLIGIRRRKNE